MKSVRIAYTILAVSLIAVIINSMILNSIIEKTITEINSVSISEENANSEVFRNIYDEFKKKETYISLTVNHEDLTTIELAFAEIIGAASTNDISTVVTTKSRLIDSLNHLKRLSGINIDSVF